MTFSLALLIGTEILFFFDGFRLSFVAEFMAVSNPVQLYSADESSAEAVSRFWNILFTVQQ